MYVSEEIRTEYHFLLRKHNLLRIELMLKILLLNVVIFSNIYNISRVLKNVFAAPIIWKFNKR